MAKEAISVSLEAQNLLWLRGRTRAGAARSVSQLLDRLVERARQGAGTPHARSVVGTLTIASDDPDLSKADRIGRAAFANSIAPRSGQAPARKPRPHG